jgi:hypothetical protein
LVVEALEFEALEFEAFVGVDCGGVESDLIGLGLFPRVPWALSCSRGRRIIFRERQVRRMVASVRERPLNLKMLATENI